MHKDRLIRSSGSEQSSEDVYAGTSVWIDPLVHQHLAATLGSPSQELQRAGGKSNKANPITPIPPRTSAYPARVVNAIPRYTRSYNGPQEEDITRIPTMPSPTMWRYESEDFEIESSLSSLSLVDSSASALSPVYEIDTLPSGTLQRKSANEQAPQKDFADLDTTPPIIAHTSEVSNDFQGVYQGSIPYPSKALSPIGHIDELDTVPPRITAIKSPQDYEQRRLALEQSRTIQTDSVSWTVGQGYNSAFAQRLISRGRHVKRRRSSALTPLDRLRWWMLVPGRIEFLLWLVGTFLLLAVTSIFLFVTMVSVGWINSTTVIVTNSSQSGNATAISNCVHPAGQGGKQCVNNTTVVQPLSFKILANGLIVQGMTISLHGQGFTNGGRVTFTHDAGFPCQPALTNADSYGQFTIEMLLGLDASWGAGHHSITAYDTLSKRSVVTRIILSPAPIGKSATPIPTLPLRGVTPTVPAGSGGPLPTPVGQTPVPTTPTVSISPTPLPTQTTATPTVGITATSVPTQTTPTSVVTTPTVSTSRATSNIVTSASSQTTSLKNQMLTTSIHLPSGIWFWFMCIAYAIAMIMLGIAGLLHRRTRSM